MHREFKRAVLVMLYGPMTEHQCLLETHFFDTTPPTMLVGGGDKSSTAGELGEKGSSMTDNINPPSDDDIPRYVRTTAIAAGDFLGTILSDLSRAGYRTDVFIGANKKYAKSSSPNPGKVQSATAVGEIVESSTSTSTSPPMVSPPSPAAPAASSDH
jgi:hypothetical protein